MNFSSRIVYFTPALICVALIVGLILRKNGELEVVPESRIEIFQGRSSSVEGKEKATRELGELYQILDESREAWHGGIGAERLFFEPYADEVVRGFTVEETRLFALEQCQLEQMNFSPFLLAVFRRWGEVDPENSLGFCSKSIIEKQSKLYSDSGSKLSFDEERFTVVWRRFFVRVTGEALVGWSQVDPVAAMNYSALVWRGVEDDFFSRSASKFFWKRDEPNGGMKEMWSQIPEDHAEHVIENLFRLNPEEADKVFEKSGIAYLGYLSSYFSGLPNETNWAEKGEKQRAYFLSEGVQFSSSDAVPLLSRWLSDDPVAAEAWLRRNTVGSTLVEGDPFADLNEIPKSDEYHYSYALGAAAMSWFKADPNRAYEWIREKVSSEDVGFLNAIFERVMSFDSSYASAKAITVVEVIQNLERRGDILLALPSIVPSYSATDDSANLLNYLKKIELTPEDRAALDRRILEKEKELRGGR